IAGALVSSAAMRRQRRQCLRGQKCVASSPGQRRSHQPRASQRHLVCPGTAAVPGSERGAAQKGARLPPMAAWAADRSQHWDVVAFDQFGLHATLWVKTQRALYYKAGKDRLLTIVLVHDPEGKRPDQRFYGTRLDWDARQILGAYA